MGTFLSRPGVQAAGCLANLWKLRLAQSRVPLNPFPLECLSSCAASELDSTFLSF